MSRNSRYFFAAIALLLSATLTVSVQAKKGGGRKPGGGGEDPPASVEYDARFIAMPNQGEVLSGVYGINGSNSVGQIVGSYYADSNNDGLRDQRRAFLSNPNSDTALDLSELVGIVPDDGFWIRNASGINWSGDISAYAEFEATPGFYEAVMIEMSIIPPVIHFLPSAASLPNAATTEYSVATGINDVGDIVCKYRKSDDSYGNYVYNFGTYEGLEMMSGLLDLGVSTRGDWPRISDPTIAHSTRVIGSTRIAGTTDLQIYRWEMGVGLDVIEDFVDADGNLVHLTAGGINADGHLCGYARITYPSKIKGRTREGRAFVMGETIDSLQTPFRSNYGGADLNLAHDFVVGNGMLYHQVEGLLDPLQLLTTEDKDFLNDTGLQVLRLDIISERESESVTGFPTLSGSVSDAGFNLSLLVVLTPQLPSEL
jgi:hypothetical protein